MARGRMEEYGRIEQQERGEQSLYTRRQGVVETEFEGGHDSRTRKTELGNLVAIDLARAG